MLLADVRVLDATQVLAGSFASMTLADLGADVVKIERPDGGDIGRQVTPFVDGKSSYYASVNRNKKSVAIDLSAPEGQQVIRDLAADADVFLENHPVGRMERFNIGYDDLIEVNSEIIYCSITGFGQSGPYAEYPALDMVAQAMSGNMSFTGPPDGPPYRAAIPIGDIAGTSYAVQSVLAALYNREHSGEGQRIDVSMLEGLTSWLTVRAGATLATGEAYPRTGNQLEEFVPYNTYETADGYLVVINVTDRHWRRLCEIIDRPELADDARFATAEARRAHRDDVNALLTDALSERSAVEWFDQLAGNGVPSAPVYDTSEVWEDEQINARGLLLDPPDGGPFPAIDYPVEFNNTETGPRRGTPSLGEDTRATLIEAGYDAQTIEALSDQGVIAVQGEPSR